MMNRCQMLWNALFCIRDSYKYRCRIGTKDSSFSGIRPFNRIRDIFIDIRPFDRTQNLSISRLIIGLEVRWFDRTWIWHCRFQICNKNFPPRIELRHFLYIRDDIIIHQYVHRDYHMPDKLPLDCCDRRYIHIATHVLIILICRDSVKVLSTV